MSGHNTNFTQATGNLGSVVLKELLSSGLFELTVLTRGSSTLTFPPEVKVVKVDYERLDSLTTALAGQDALVSTLPSNVAASQKLLIDAAVKAGVKRVIPTEYGCDLHNELTRKLPVYAGKVQIEEYLEQLAVKGSISYTLVFNGPLLDLCLRQGLFFNFKDRKVDIYDGGEVPISTTRYERSLPKVSLAPNVPLLPGHSRSISKCSLDILVGCLRAFKTFKGKFFCHSFLKIYGRNKWLIPRSSRLTTVGKAVRRILTHPRETADRAVWVKDLDVTQNELVKLAQALTPGEKWEVRQVDTVDLEKESLQQLQKKEISPTTMLGFLRRAVFAPGYGSTFKFTHNDVLGISGMTEPDLHELVRSICSTGK